MTRGQCLPELKPGRGCLWFSTRGPLFPLCAALNALGLSLSLFLSLALIFLLPVCLPLPAFLWRLSIFQVLTPDSPELEQEWVSPCILEASAEASAGVREEGESTTLLILEFVPQT